MEKYKFENKPIEWLEFCIREQIFCRNHQIEYIHQLIDTDLVLNIRGFSVLKVFRLITAKLKEKTEIEFKFICVGNDTYKIVQNKENIDGIKC